jgi:RNA recognition motif-containing protein
MSLFVGNISRTASERDLEKAFEKFGDCHFRFRGAYGFIEFDNEQDGEDAKEKLQGKSFGGMRINIGISIVIQNGARSREGTIRVKEREEVPEGGVDLDPAEGGGTTAGPAQEGSNIQSI